MYNKTSDYTFAAGAVLSIVGAMFLPINGISPKSNSFEASYLINSGLTENYGLVILAVGIILIGAGKILAYFGK